MRKKVVKFQTKKNQDDKAWYACDLDFECECSPVRGDWEWDVDRERWVCTSCERAQ